MKTISHTESFIYEILVPTTNYKQLVEFKEFLTINGFEFTHETGTNSNVPAGRHKVSIKMRNIESFFTIYSNVVAVTY